jgi:hypothetical protein
MQLYNRCPLNTLLDALEGNVHVSSFTLDLYGMPGQHFDCASLCHYLSESKALRSVTITCKRNLGFSSFPGRLVRALTENALIEEVTFCGDLVIENWYEDFLAFIQSKTQSLRRLSIPWIQWTNELGLAVGSLQSLEYLTLVHSVDFPLDLMLQRLQSYRRLRMLSVDTMCVPFFDFDDTMVLPLSSLLCSEVPLESLELKNFEYSPEHLVPLLNAMYGCSTLVRLVLTGALQNETAARAMADWFCQPREPLLRELCLCCENFFQDSYELMMSTLTPLEGSPQRSSAGTSLLVLELDTRWWDIKVLVKALADKRSQIVTLSLRILERVTSEQLTRYLPDMMILRTLNVKRVIECCTFPFLNALRQNGSLQTVSLGTELGSVFTTTELLRIQSYCDRNHWAAGLLKDSGQLDAEDATLLSLCPLFWHAVKPARRMAARAFLGGLLACKEAIGPHGGTKRIASEAAMIEFQETDG